jgi:hypothetical protein
LQNLQNKMSAQGIRARSGTAARGQESFSGEIAELIARAARQRRGLAMVIRRQASFRPQEVAVHVSTMRMLLVEVHGITRRTIATWSGVTIDLLPNCLATIVAPRTASQHMPAPLSVDVLVFRRVSVFRVRQGVRVSVCRIVCGMQVMRTTAERSVHKHC